MTKPFGIGVVLHLGLVLSSFSYGLVAVTLYPRLLLSSLREVTALGGKLLRVAHDSKPSGSCIIFLKKGVSDTG